MSNTLTILNVLQILICICSTYFHKEPIFTRKEMSPTLNRNRGVNFQRYMIQFFKHNNQGASIGEFQKRISQLQFSYHPLRTEKGFSKIFGSNTWVLLNSFESLILNFEIKILFSCFMPVYVYSYNLIANHILKSPPSTPTWNNEIKS